MINKSNFNKVFIHEDYIEENVEIMKIPKYGISVKFKRI